MTFTILNNYCLSILILYGISAYITVYARADRRTNMPAKLSTTLKKLDLVSVENRIILEDFHEYMICKNLRSEHHIANLLTLLISLDKFYGPIPFTSINTKEQILRFLDHQYLKGEGQGKWVKRERDAEGRYVTTFNQNKRLLSVFYRWLFNRNKSDDDWETPSFLKIKAKKSLRDSPYGVNDIWQLDEVLTIVSYEPELRNQAIITLLWDLDARPHEITALRVKDIILNEHPN